MISSKTSDRRKQLRLGRPRGFEEGAALDAAMMLFWRKGYRDTSLADLVAAMGVPRASIYQVFGDKRALFIKCLDLYGARFSQRMKQVMAGEPDGRRALATILNASADRLTSAAGPAGCLRCDATVALMGTDAALDKALIVANARYLKNMQKLCRRSTRDGALSAETAKRLPIFITAFVAGMVTLARGGASRAEMAVLIEQALALWPSRCSH